ncbi:hypothetical protein Godav_020513 [Gossypium davidsonii]|uniref:Uncharacterized protein n=1 Tax=Gossypium davidsonii TaxID=34287 RepID=A0A7J8R3W1_GOSDV|nr:hypothetical protein [Gossypium davidsonii]
MLKRVLLAREKRDPSRSQYPNRS